MIKKYIHVILVFVGLLLVTSSYSQTIKTNYKSNATIEGLMLYPNPVSNGKLYITTSKNLTKNIEIFDVLGKKIYNTTLNGNVMDISRLKAGIYIIKIIENNSIANRKLVVK